LSDDDFKPRTNEDNPDPRVACALLFDTSASMGESGSFSSEGAAESKIDALNRGFATFCDAIEHDELAAKRTEILVVGFGGNNARVEIPFTEGRDLKPQTFFAAGGTPMGDAVNLALDELTAQKQSYKDAGIEYYRPWIFIFSDGEPNDGAFLQAADRLCQMEAAKGVAVYPIGVGSQANLEKLGKLSKVRTPLQLAGLKFEEFFNWLSNSMAAVANSAAHGSDDSAIATAAAGEQHALPSPAGWATW
jgi:uncharacterized protein YegL